LNLIVEKYFKYCKILVIAGLLFGLQYQSFHHTHEHTSGHEVTLHVYEGDCLACQLDFSHHPFLFLISAFVFFNIKIKSIVFDFYSFNTIPFSYLRLSNKSPPIFN
jgi:hypothetical protein